LKWHHDFYCEIVMEFTEKHFTPSRGFGDGRKAHRSAVALAKPGCGTVDWHVGSENSSRLEIVDLHGSWISLGLR